MSDKISSAALPGKVKRVTISLDSKELWSGKFAISFSAFNAAVKWHLPDPIQELQYTTQEDSAGFARYAVIFNGIGSLGEICLRELPDKRFTMLIITAPNAPRSPQWTDEEKALIEAQSGRQSKLEVMHGIATKIAGEREEILKYQKIIFTKFLKRLSSDPEIVQASITFYANNAMSNEEWKTHHRRLKILKEKAAYQGISTPPEITMEIEDITSKLREAFGLDSHETDE